MVSIGVKLINYENIMKCWRIFYIFCAQLFLDPFSSNITSALVHLRFVLKNKWVSWVVCCRRVPLSLKTTTKKRYAEEISWWISFRVHTILSYKDHSKFLSSMVLIFSQNFTSNCPDVVLNFCGFFDKGSPPLTQFSNNTVF